MSTTPRTMIQTIMTKSNPDSRPSLMPGAPNRERSSDSFTSVRAGRRPSSLFSKASGVRAIHRLPCVTLLLALFIVPSLFAAMSVTVHSLDEGLTETNISKPRIYVTNTGNVAITDFVYYYYFTTESGKVPVLEDYYSPECNVSLEQIGTDSYRLRYQLTGATLSPGEVLPSTDGNVVGLHYNDWSAWNKANDYSNNQSATFAQNTKIPLYVDGTLIYGTEPAGSGGSLTRELWTGISGTAVSAIPVTTPFNSTGTISSFEEAQNVGDNYGTRIRGYITAPTTGSYTFWIAGDDCCELRLSTTDRPENKSTIASVSGYTDYRQWNKYTSQKSAAISLTTGQRYYVEALHKEAGGYDNLSVGWARPGQSTSAPSEVIPGGVLTPFTGPNATPSLTATLASPTQINLSWTDPCTNEDGYRIERSVSGGAFSFLIDRDVNVSSYQDGNLTANTVYSYRVRAFNSQGSSAWSNTFTLTTQESTSGAVVRELWTSVSGGYISNIPVNTTPNQTSTITLLQGPTNSADQYGARVRGIITAPATGSYTFWISADDRAEFWLSTTSSPANMTKIAYVPSYNLNPLSWNDNQAQKSSAQSLTQGARYYFEVLHKEDGGGDHVAVGWAKPGQGTTSPSEIVPGSVLSKFVAPVAPSNLVATALSGTSIALSWSDNSDNEESFAIEKSLDGTNFTALTTKPANGSSHTVTGLMPATTYWFRARASNGAGASSWSNTASATTHQTTAGGITRDVWTGISGSGVSSIPVTTAPTFTETHDDLDPPRNWADNYGERLRGYLTPPATGDYTFWICGDDQCALRLSTTQNPADTAKIAFVSGYTGVSEWNKYPTEQKSAPVALVEGKRYYIEVLHKEAGGLDHVQVGWLKPGETGTIPSEIISGSVLSTFTPPAAPSNCAATPVSSTQIDVSWTDNSDNETAFIVQWGLAGQAFSDSASTAPGSNSFAVTGLTPNTQYQFRLKAKNYAGVSAYTNTATAISNASGDQPGPVFTPELLSFAIYSQEQTTVGSRSMFTGGGAVGSNTFVYVHPDAKIFGSLVSGGNAELTDRDTVNGDVTCGGTLTKSASVAISGTVTENASVTTVDIPVEPAFVYGTVDITANSGQTIALDPGAYRACTINPGGTVVFSAGSYTFQSLIIGNDAFAKFNIPMDQSIDINVETTLEIRDRATAEFMSRGYAPTIRIYTNDYSFEVGCDARLTGLIFAPHAAVSIKSRSNIGGALYAKRITIEPDAVIVSNFANPNADGDGDGIPNLTEMAIGDPPDDGTIYTLMGVPYPAMINNSIEQTVTYDFGLKYPYFSGSRKILLTFPANSLIKKSVAPGFTLTNKPSDAGIPEFNLPGYKPIGNYLGMIANSVKPGASVDLALPVFVNAMPGITRRIAWYDDGTNTWTIADKGVQPDGSDGSAVYGRGIENASAVIIVEAESKAVAYLDNGEVYSTDPVAAIEANVTITGAASAPPTAAGTLRIKYKEYPVGTPGGVDKPDIVIGLRYNYGILYATGRKSALNPLKITQITIVAAENSINYTLTKDFNIAASQTITLNIIGDVGEINSTTYTGEKIAALYNPNTLAFESMPFDEGVIKQTRSATPTWYRHFYLRDHLGSTRLVIDDNDGLVGATMYQAYGDMVDLQATTETVRERFTGKEYDADGAIDGAQGMKLSYFGARYYDPNLGIFVSTDPAGEFHNAYRYTNNPLGFIDPSGLDSDPYLSGGEFSWFNDWRYTTNYQEHMFSSAALGTAGFLYSAVGGTANLTTNILFAPFDLLNQSLIEIGIDEAAQANLFMLSQQFPGFLDDVGAYVVNAPRLISAYGKMLASAFKTPVDEMAEESSYLYRTISKSDPHANQFKKVGNEGVINPRGGHNDLTRHVQFDDTKSIFTSWSKNKEANWQQWGGEDFIQVRVNFNTMANDALDVSKWSHYPFEDEVTIIGQIKNAMRIR